MNYWTDLRIKIIDFFKRNKRKILVIIIIWLIIFMINLILKNMPQKLPAPQTTYTPHVSVMDKEDVVPEKYQEPIENVIDTYFNYCNNGEYEKAYNLITTDCRKKNYPTLEQFEGYINEIFEGKKKIYNIQSYSIVDNKYIYNVRILDDILANGTTDGYYYYEEKFVMLEENGEIKLSIAEFVEDKKLNSVSEDDNIIIEVLNKTVDYSTETYTVKFTNKTDNYIVIADNVQDNEVLLDMGDEQRAPINSTIQNIFMTPHSSVTHDFQFTKFYDDGSISRGFIFNAVRILKTYNWQEGTTQEELDNAVKLYGLKIDF